MTDLTIIIASCDAYVDIAQQYINFLKMNWRNCRFPIIVAMEEVDFVDDCVLTLPCGKNTTWTERVIKAIRRADSEYVLLSVDDLFISETINNDAIEEVLEFIKKEKIKYYRIPVFKFGNKNVEKYKGSPNVELIKSNERYNVSIGTAIWDSSELLDVLGDGSMSAWDLENYFLKKAELAKPGYIEKYVSDDRFLLHTTHMIKSGKWIPSSVNKMKNAGYNIDTSKRGYIGLVDRLKLNRFYSWCSRKFPSWLRKPIKKIMRAFGYKFASD